MFKSLHSVYIYNVHNVHCTQLQIITNKLIMDIYLLYLRDSKHNKITRLSDKFYIKNVSVQITDDVISCIVIDKNKNMNIIQ